LPFPGEKNPLSASRRSLLHGTLRSRDWLATSVFSPFPGGFSFRGKLPGSAAGEPNLLHPPWAGPRPHILPVILCHSLYVHLAPVSRSIHLVGRTRCILAPRHRGPVDGAAFRQFFGPLAFLLPVFPAGPLGTFSSTSWCSSRPLPIVVFFPAVLSSLPDLPCPCTFFHSLPLHPFQMSFLFFFTLHPFPSVFLLDPSPRPGFSKPLECRVLSARAHSFLSSIDSPARMNLSHRLCLFLFSARCALPRECPTHSSLSAPTLLCPVASWPSAPTPRALNNVPALAAHGIMQ